MSRATGSESLRQLLCRSLSSLAYVSSRHALPSGLSFQEDLWSALALLREVSFSGGLNMFEHFDKKLLPQVSTRVQNLGTGANEMSFHTMVRFHLVCEVVLQIKANWLNCLESLRIA